jgi:hypothetical protein
MMAFKTRYKCEYCGTKFWCHEDEIDQHVCEVCHVDNYDVLQCHTCEWYSCQKENGRIVTTFCKRFDNLNKSEGNTNIEDCPIHNKLIKKQQ